MTARPPGGVAARAEREHGRLAEPQDDLRARGRGVVRGEALAEEALDPRLRATGRELDEARAHGGAEHGFGAGVEPRERALLVAGEGDLAARALERARGRCGRRHGRPRSAASKASSSSSARAPKTEAPAAAAGPVDPGPPSRTARSGPSASAPARRPRGPPARGRAGPPRARGRPGARARRGRRGCPWARWPPGSELRTRPSRGSRPPCGPPRRAARPRRRRPPRAARWRAAAAGAGRGAP